MDLRKGYIWLESPQNRQSHLDLQCGNREGNSTLLEPGGKASSARRATGKEAMISDIAPSYRVRQTPNRELVTLRLVYPTAHA
jgi:hypothetical protein